MPFRIEKVRSVRTPVLACDRRKKRRAGDIVVRVVPFVRVAGLRLDRLDSEQNGLREHFVDVVVFELLGDAGVERSGGRRHEAAARVRRSVAGAMALLKHVSGAVVHPDDHA